MTYKCLNVTQRWLKSNFKVICLSDPPFRIPSLGDKGKVKL